MVARLPKPLISTCITGTPSSSNSGKTLPVKLASLTPGRLLWVTLVPFEGFSISLNSGDSSITHPPLLPPSHPKILLHLIISPPQMPLLLNLLLRLSPPPKPPLLLGDSVALASLFVQLLASFATRFSLFPFSSSICFNLSFYVNFRTCI